MTILKDPQEIWLVGGEDELLVVLGKLELTSRIEGDKFIVSAKYPVLWRRNALTRAAPDPPAAVASADDPEKSAGG